MRKLIVILTLLGLLAVFAIPAAAQDGDFEVTVMSLIENRDVTASIEWLDEQWEDAINNQRGSWTESDADSGYTIPAASYFWTDLFEDAAELPLGTYPVIIEGGYGIFYTLKDHTVSNLSSGGRYLQSNVVPPDYMPATQTELNHFIDSLVNDDDTISSLIGFLDEIYEMSGWVTGGSWNATQADNGYIVPLGSLYWTNHHSSSLPIGVSRILSDEGWGVFYTTRDVEIPATSTGGRWMPLGTN